MRQKMVLIKEGIGIIELMEKLLKMWEVRQKVLINSWKMLMVRIIYSIHYYYYIFHSRQVSSIQEDMYANQYCVPLYTFIVHIVAFKCCLLWKSTSPNTEWSVTNFTSLEAKIFQEGDSSLDVILVHP